MEFTFGICTYNSGKFIIQTLESIKYQVITYGEDVSSLLIVSDDASTDNTVSLVKYWIEENKELFFESRVLTNDCNLGIAHNYSKLMANINTEYFKTIDGDDLLSSVNIYAQIKNVINNNLCVFFPLRFNKSGIYIAENDYYNMFYYYKIQHEHKKDLWNLETVKPFITPEICYLRHFFDKETETFVKEYTQFEDDTTLYAIFKKNKDMRLEIFLEPMILYRVHENSLSNGKENASQIKFLDDLHKFKKVLFKQERNILIKLILMTDLFDTFRMKHRFDTKKSVHRMIENYYMNKRKKKAESYDEYGNYKIAIDEYKEREVRHLDYIYEKAIEFEKIYSEKA